MCIFPLKLIIITLIVSLLISCKPSNNADMILYNGKIHSIDKAMKTYQAMAIIDGKIVALGKDEDILSNYKYEESIDLSGYNVYPGFIDPHSHFTGYSANLLNADLTGSTSMDMIVERLKKHSEKISTDWIIGRGWDQNLWQDRKMPGNKLLNQAFPDKPVSITRVDGHAMVVNDEALRIAGITDKTIVEGGEVVTENGKVTGLLIDKAMDLIETYIPLPLDDQLISVMKEAQNNLFSVGLTSVSDSGIDKNEILFLDSLQKSGDIKIRIYAMLNPKRENIEYFSERGKYVTDKLNVRSIKLFADGALGSRGALLLEPYSDDSDNYGIMMEDVDFMEEICEFAYNNDFQVNTHCIGDSAARVVLNIYKKFLTPENDLRWRIEHAQIIDPSDLKKFGKYNVVPSIQAIHAISDMGWAEGRLGNRIENAYTYKSLLEQNGWIANGSDFPVEPINPLYGYHAAFARKDRDGNPGGGFLPDEAISREEALKAMTIWAAKANFEDHVKGSLEKGKVADFVVIKENLLTAPENIIYDVKIQQTFLNGELVYSR